MAELIELISSTGITIGDIIYGAFYLGLSLGLFGKSRRDNRITREDNQE